MKNATVRKGVSLLAALFILSLMVVVNVPSTANVTEASSFSAISAATFSSSPTDVTAGRGKPYSFLSVGPDGSPDRWNPCKPITWGIVAKGFPAKELPLLKKAFKEISKITGLTFRYVGLSKNYTVSQYTHMSNIPNVDISLRFEDFKKTSPKYAGAAGYGGRAVSSGSSSELRRVGPGQARFDTGDLPRMTPLQHYVLYLHEIGHVIGLGHVKNPSSIMYPSLNKVSRFSAADRAGLKLLGRQAGDCDPGSLFYNDAFPPAEEDGSTEPPSAPVNLTAVRTPEGGLLITWGSKPGNIVRETTVTVQSTNMNTEWGGVYELGQEKIAGGRLLISPQEMQGLLPGETIEIVVSQYNDSGTGEYGEMTLVW